MHHQKPCLGDVEIAEALAILEGLKLAAEVTLSPLVIESDSKNVTNFILKGISSRGELDWFISEIRALIDKDTQYRVVYTPRSCNLVAHGLAKMALATSESRVWIEEVSKELEVLLEWFVFSSGNQIITDQKNYHELLIKKEKRKQP